MASYNIEQAMGHADWNILTVAMRQFGFDIQKALDWAAKYHYEMQSKFLSHISNVPSFGSDEIDRDVANYIFYLGTWVHGNVVWQFNNERYFKKQPLESGRDRIVEMYPKMNGHH